MAGFQTGRPVLSDGRSAFALPVIAAVYSHSPGSRAK
jgi:hypothetical protein